MWSAHLQALEQWGSESALRCIACAYAAVPGNRAQLQPEDEGNLVFLGALGLQDPPRPEAADAVQACFAAGIRLIMLTGARIRRVQKGCCGDADGLLDGCRNSSQMCLQCNGAAP